MTMGASIFWNIIHILQICTVCLLVFPIGTASNCPSQCQCISTTVNCSSAGLRQIPDDIPYDVDTLYLDHNLIPHIDDGAFSNLSALVNLDLSHNVLTSLQQTALMDLDVLTDLYISSNQLADIDEGSFDTLSSLSKLDLHDNLLSHLPETIFQMLPLSDLDLRDNRFDNAVFSAIVNCPIINQLDLSSNPLETLPYLMLSTMQNLQFLELNNANITDIDVNAFIGLSSLSFLYLSNNLIQDVKRETFQPLGAINAIDLSGNPLECSCNTKKFQDWLEANVNDNILRPDVTCSDFIQGGDIDIERGELDHLCFDNATSTTPEPTYPPPGDCDRDATLILSVSDTEGPQDSVYIIWTYDLIEDDNIISMDCRYFKKDSFFSFETEVLTQGILLENLEVGEDYVCCGLVYTCGVYSCVDFDTGIIVEDCPDVGFIVGLTMAVILCVVLLIGVIIFMVYCIQKRKQPMQYDDAKLESTRTSRNPDIVPSPSNEHRESAPPSLPRPRPPPLRQNSGSYSEINPYETYEIIPGETMDANLKSTFGNPGYLQKTPSQRAEVKPEGTKKDDKRQRANTAPSKSSKASADKEMIDHKRLTTGQYLHASDSPSTEVRKPRRFTKPATQNCENVAMQPLQQQQQVPAGHINMAFSAGSSPGVSHDQMPLSHDHSGLRSSDPMPRTDANSNNNDAKEYLAPSSLTLPPKKTMTVVNAQIRAMHDGSAGYKQSNVISTAI